MITDLIVRGLLALVAFLLALLPDDTVTWPEASSYGSYVGALVGPLDALLPVSEVAAITVLTVTVIMPALLVYRLSMWLWTLLPDSVSGSGPS